MTFVVFLLGRSKELKIGVPFRAGPVSEAENGVFVARVVHVTPVELQLREPDNITSQLHSTQ